MNLIWSENVFLIVSLWERGDVGRAHPRKIEFHCGGVGRRGGGGKGELTGTLHNGLFLE